MSDEKYDRIAAFATGVGVGLIALMVVWLIGNRVATAALGTPGGPIVAFTTAILAGAAIAIYASRRLVRSTPIR